MALNIFHFKETLVYNTTSSVTEALYDLNALRVMDLKKEKTERFWKRVMAGCLLALLPVVIWAFMTKENLGLGLMALMFLLGVGAILGFIFQSIEGRLNIDNRRYELMDRVLKLLSADSAPNAVVALESNFKRHDHKSKRTHTGMVGDWKVAFYKDPWLHLSGTLADGTRYQLTMTEHVQRRSKWKQSVSGKRKQKKKIKSACDVVVTLKPKRKRYAAIDQIADRLAGAVELPEWADFKGIQIKDNNAIVVRAGAKFPAVDLNAAPSPRDPPKWDVATTPDSPVKRDGVQLVASLFLTLYHALNLARVMTRAQNTPSR